MASILPLAAGWKEFKSPDGRAYYYHAETEESRWDRPVDSIKQPDNVVPVPTCPWKEFKAQDGRSYFYNATTKQSVWEKPKELEAFELAMVAAAAALQKSVALAAPPKPIPVIAPVVAPVVLAPAVIDSPDDPGDDTGGSGFDYATKEEAMQVFRQLLTEKGVGSSWPWDKAMRLIQSDTRYDALKRLNEKKKCFNAWKPLRAKEEKEEARIKLKHAREELFNLLTAMPLTHRAKFRDIESSLKDNPVFTALPSARERQDVFDEVLSIKEKAAKEEERMLKKRNIEALHKLFASFPNITFRMPWKDAEVFLKASQFYQSSTELQACEMSDVLVAYEDFIKELEKAEDDTRRKEREAQRRLGRKIRDAFGNVLKELEENNVINAGTLWKDVYPTIAATPAYSALVNEATGSRPLDLFKLHVEDLKERLHEDKRVVRDILKTNNFSVESNTTPEEFLSKIKTDGRFGLVNPNNMSLVFLTLIERAAEKDREEQKALERRTKRAAGNFTSMLSRNISKFTAQSTWVEVRDLFAEKQDFVEVATEFEREQLFKDFLASNPFSDSSSSSEEEDDHHHSRESSKRRHRHRSSKSSNDSASSDSEEESRKKRKRKDKKKSSKKSKKKKSRHHSSSSSSSDNEREKGASSKKEKTSSKVEDGDSESESELQRKRDALLSQLSDVQ